MDIIPRIKICCIQNRDEVKMAVQHGASAVGLVSAMPSGPGPISDDKIREIAATVPPGVASFLLTSKTDVLEIIQQQRYCRCNTIQLCDMLPPASHLRLRQALPGIDIVQVIHVTGRESVQKAKSVALNVDAILLDSGNPDAKVKVLGGTGRTHNWEISREIVESVPVPVYLAGGLNPENVAQAIERVWPYGVDICSGLRVNGLLQDGPLKAFVKAAGARY